MTKRYSGRVIHQDYESSAGNRFYVQVFSDDTGIAILRPINRDGGNSSVPLTFRSGLYDDIAGQPDRWTRVCHDTTFAGVDLAVELT